LNQVGVEVKGVPGKLIISFTSQAQIRKIPRPILPLTGLPWIPIPLQPLSLISTLVAGSMDVVTLYVYSMPSYCNWLPWI
jgi:hypothetical protein